MGIDFNLKEIKALYELMSQTGVKKCSYCGSVATDIEHVIPKSFFGDDRPNLRKHRKMNNLVMSCRECNLVAGSNVFGNFWEKKRFIADKLRKKYRKILLSPNWSQKYYPN